MLEVLRARLSTFSLRWLPGGAHAGAVYQLSGGTATAQALVILTAPALTRLFSPAEMGRFGVLLSFIAFTSAVVNLRYDMAIVSARSDAEADRLLALSVLVVAPMSLAATVLIVALLKLPIASFERLPAFGGVPTFVLLFAIGVFTAVRAWAVRRGEFAEIGRSSLEQGVGRALVPVVAGLLGAGWWGLLLGEIAGRLLGVIRLLRLASHALTDVMRTATRSLMRQTIRTTWRYPVVAAPSTLLDALGGALVLPLLAAAFGQAAAGELLVVQRVASVPAALIGASIADVFHSRVATVFSDAPREVRGLVLRTARRLLLVASAIYIPLGIASLWIFDDVFGARWQRAGVLIAIFTPLNIATLVVSPVTRLYFVTNRMELKLWFDVLLIAIPIIAFVVLERRGLSYWACMGVFVTLSTAAYLLQFVLTLRMAAMPARNAGVSDVIDPQPND